MSVTGSQSSASHTTQSEATVPISTRNKAGFVLASLLSLPNLVGPLSPTPEGEAGPPMLVLVLGSVLGLVTIGAVVLAWTRGNRSAVRVAAAAIIVGAVTALPAFFVPDVPAGLRVMAAVSVLVAIIAVVLMLTPARPAAGQGA
jgi:hypothetical protein